VVAGGAEPTLTASGTTSPMELTGLSSSAGLVSSAGLASSIFGASSSFGASADLPDSSTLVGAGAGAVAGAAASFLSLFPPRSAVLTRRPSLTTGFSFLETGAAATVASFADSVALGGSPFVSAFFSGSTALSALWPVFNPGKNELRRFSLSLVSAGGAADASFVSPSVAGASPDVVAGSVSAVASVVVGSSVACSPDLAASGFFSVVGCLGLSFGRSLSRKVFFSALGVVVSVFVSSFLSSSAAVATGAAASSGLSSTFGVSSFAGAGSADFFSWAGLSPPIFLKKSPILEVRRVDLGSSAFFGSSGFASSFAGSSATAAAGVVVSAGAGFDQR